MSVSKVQRSRDAAAAVIYAVYGTKKAMKAGSVRAAAVSVVGPRGSNPVVWVMETRSRVQESVQRRNETINIIQSFSPDELDPDNPLDVEKAHAAGLALAAKMAPDCDVVVATHTDTAHVHNHIIVANHDRGTGRAAPKAVGNAWRVRETNDDVMEVFGLKVLGRDPVSLSRDERVAQAKGVDIDGSDLSLSELTRETWREFARARIEELLEDDRVIAALDIDGGGGVEPGLEVMEEIAFEYHLSFSRKGRGKRTRKSERSSFALVGDDGKELRLTDRNGKGSSKAATAGSRLGSDYTMDGLRARLHEIHAERLIDGMEIDNNGGQQTTATNGQHGVAEQVGLAADGANETSRGREGSAGRDARGRGAALGELSEATDGLEQAHGVLAAFNSGDEGIREGDGSSDGLDEVDGGDRGRAAGGDSAPARGTAEVGDRDRGAANVDGRLAEDRARTRRRAAESQRRRSGEAERQRREALESDGPRPPEDDYGPDF